MSKVSKLLGFIAFVAIGLGLLVLSILRGESTLITLKLILVGGFFIYGLYEHYKELIEQDDLR